MMRDSVKKMEKIKKNNSWGLRLACCLLLTPIVLDSAYGVTTSRIWSSPSTGYAVDGYDAVAYFTDAKPRKGLPGFEYVWGGVAWRFVNEGNLDAFKRSPEVYVPQFGGYGAGGVYKNLLLPPNPLYWGLYEKKLYLFRSARAKKQWDSNIKAHLDVARKNWQTLVKNLDQ